MPRSRRAIDASSAGGGDEIIVAPGTYNEAISGKGGAYTIDATAFDGSGNFGASSREIVVPKSQGKGGN